jgi:hypothetical protein
MAPCFRAAAGTRLAGPYPGPLATSRSRAIRRPRESRSARELRDGVIRIGLGCYSRFAPAGAARRAGAQGR